MNPFNRRTALRIAAVSLLLAAVAGPVAWSVAQRKAKDAIVSLAMEESRHLSVFAAPGSPGGPDSAARDLEAVRTLVGGLFDIAELYDRRGGKLAEAVTSEGAEVEAKLPRHGQPTYTEASYDSLELEDGRWVMRVFVPLRGAGGGEIHGYFEGVRVVPPWQRGQIRANALSAALMVVLASLLCGLAIYPVVVRLSSDNARKTREVLDSHISMMEALGRAIAKRDSDTGGHNYRVAWIAARVGETLGLRGQDMQSLIAGSFLHDVGKIGVSDTILLKPGRLDEAEFAVMRTHVALGEEIVTGMGWLDGARAVVAGHHEKWNGTGYPRRLDGEDIPLSARIFAVADVFDALCSRRPYKEAMGFGEAMAILERETGSHFDPRVMAAFRPMAREVFDTLAACDEERTRLLLQGRVHHHFGI